MSTPLLCSLLRLPALLLLWLLLSGSAFISCSSGGGGDNDGSFNYAPIAANSYLVTRVNVAVSSLLRAEDRNGDPLTFRIISGPSLGSIDYFDPYSGRFSYISYSSGTDSFTFIASDGGAVSNVAVVTITVNRISTALQPLRPEEAPPPGLTWVEASTQAPTVDPFNTAHWLKYARNQGILHSPDQGATWTVTPLDPALLQDSVDGVIAYHGLTPNLAYLAINTSSAGYRLLRSIDGGATWVLIGQDPSTRIAALTATALLADGSIVVYARLQGQPGLYRLSDYPY